MIHEDEIKLQINIIRNTVELPSPPPSPRIPNIQNIASIKTKVEIIQRFITNFQYNYTGTPYIKLNKRRGMSHISSCAKEIIRLGLPIQCIEAVFLGCFLTAEINGLDRIPLSFKSKHDVNTHRHIVLALRYNNKWGAIGISRRNNLMYKDIIYPSLYDLIQEYKTSYSHCGHRLIKIYLGLPFSHDIHCDMTILWRIFKHTTYEDDNDDLQVKLDYFTSNMMKTFEFFHREGMLPSNNRKREGIPTQPGGPPRRTNSVPRSQNNENENNGKNNEIIERRRGRSKSGSGNGSGGGGGGGNGGRNEKDEKRMSRAMTRGMGPTRHHSPSPFDGNTSQQMRVNPGNKKGAEGEERFLEEDGFDDIGRRRH